MSSYIFNRRGGYQKKTTSYRSGLEDRLANQLTEAGIPVSYETHVITYSIPEKNHRYTPDFVLPNGIIVESKGLFEATDRQKHLFIKKQHPNLEIRFVFSNPRTKLYKGSKTTYAAWCEKHGFQYATKYIPHEWLTDKTQYSMEGLNQKNESKT